MRDIPVVPIGETVSSYYLRLELKDRVGVLAQLTHVFAEQGISIEAVVQKEPLPGVTTASIVLLTHPVKESIMNHAIPVIEKMDGMLGHVVHIRVETL